MLYDRDYMRDEDRARWRSPVVALVVVLGALFLVESFLQVFGGGRSLGPDFGLNQRAVARGEVWRLFTFQFLHTAPWPFHFLFNALGLWFFGRPIIETQGRSRFWLIYLGSGLVGGLFEMALQAWHPGYAAPYTLGASANVLGLVGAFCLLDPTREVTFFLYVLPVHLRAMTMFWVFFAFSLFGSVFPSGGVAHAAHLGGLLAGAAYVKLFLGDAAQDWLRRLVASRARRRTEVPVTTLRSDADVAVRRSPERAGAEPEDSAEFIRREVDPILDKISAHGIHSLTERERRTLERARERMQKPGR